MSPRFSGKIKHIDQQNLLGALLVLKSVQIEFQISHAIIDQLRAD